MKPAAVTRLRPQKKLMLLRVTEESQETACRAVPNRKWKSSSYK